MINEKQIKSLELLIKAARDLAGKVDNPYHQDLKKWEKKAEQIVSDIFGETEYLRFRNQGPSPGLFTIEPRKSFWVKHYKQLLNHKAEYLESLMDFYEISDEKKKPVDRWEFHSNIESKCIPLFNDQHYAEATEKALKCVKEKLRKLTKFETGSDAFGKGNLYIKGAIASNVEDDFNKGVQFLCMSIDRFRNEKVHSIDANISEPERALEYLAMCSLTLRFLDNVKIKRPRKTKK